MKLFSKSGKRELTEKEKETASSIREKLEANIKNNYSDDDITRAEKMAEEKYKNRKALEGLWDKIRVLFFIARYPSLWGFPVAVSASAAVLYLVLPIDAVPDIIVPMGLVDDIAVITGTIALIVKTVSSFSKEKLLNIRGECPGDLLSTFDRMFGIEEKSPQEHGVEECETIVETPVEGVVHSIEKGLFTTKEIVKEMRNNLDFSGDDIRDGRLYKTLDKVSDAGNRIAFRALEIYLNLEILKKSVKSLISYILFALSLYFFALKDESIFFLVLSSLFMLSSYAFFIISLIKNVPRVFSFIRGYFKGGIEEAVVSVFFKRAEREPSLKEELVRCGVKRLKNGRELLALLYRNFGSSLAVFLIKMLLIIAAFFALKRVVLYTTGVENTFKILFAPVVEFVKTINQ